MSDESKTGYYIFAVIVLVLGVYRFFIGHLGFNIFLVWRVLDVASGIVLIAALNAKSGRRPVPPVSPTPSEQEREAELRKERNRAFLAERNLEQATAQMRQLQEGEQRQIEAIKELLRAHSYKTRKVTVKFKTEKADIIFEGDMDNEPPFVTHNVPGGWGD